MKSPIVSLSINVDLLSHPYRTDPNDPIKELGIQTKKIELILDGGNVVKCHDIAIMTTKVYEENDGDFEIVCDTLNGKLPSLRRLIIISRDPHPEEIYGHADGMVRFIRQNHLLVNSQYPEAF